MTGARVLMPLTDAFGGHGGIALYNRDVLKALSDSPRVAAVIALPRVAGRFAEVLPPKVDWRPKAAGGGSRFIWAAGRAAVANRPIDLIWCAHVNLLPLAAMLKLATGAKLLLAIYGVEAWTAPPRAGVRHALRWVDQVLSISDCTLDRFVDWSDFDRNRATVVANAIDLSLYGEAPRDPALIARYGLEDRETVMIFGRMHPTEGFKGFDELLEAMPAIRTARPRAMALLAGDGGDRPRLEAKATALGVGDVVRFTGRVPEEEKAALYRLADAYVMPSRQEGFGFVHLEAMACGVPAVASLADGAREAVRNGAIGRLVDPADRAAIVRETIAALDTPPGVPPGLTHFAYPRFAAEIDRMLAEILP